ncbi:hypothetical protein RCL1_001569 [Eukaryota sp. TZLM3-RCL]
MSKPPKKKARVEEPQVSVTEIQAFLEEMRLAASADVEAYESNNPALSKVKFLPKLTSFVIRSELHGDLIDNGFLRVCSDWLAPFSDASLPSLKVRTELLKILEHLTVTLESLENSDLGAYINYLANHPEETLSNKDLCRRLIDRWTQLIVEEEDEEQPVPVVQRRAPPPSTPEAYPTGSKRSYLAAPAPRSSFGFVAPKSEHLKPLEKNKKKKKSSKK